jgi:hypothetical protein
LESREKVIFGNVLDNNKRQDNWFKYAAEVDPKKSKEENIENIFKSQIKEAQNRIYSEKKTDLINNLEYILMFIQKGNLEMSTPEEVEKIKERVNKLYKKGYDQYSAEELVGYLKSNLERLVEEKK